MTHNELILEFCKSLDQQEWMVFREPTLGMRSGNKTAKPDVLTINKSWANYEVRAFEIKVKQSDLNQDVKKLKFENYRPWSHRITFVLGPDIKEDLLLPHPVGIIKLTKGGFQNKRSAPRVEAPTDMTKSWDLFHALNMGDSRYQKPSKYEQISKAQEFLEIAKHRDRWNEDFRITIAELRNHVTAAKDAESSEAYKKIKKKFSDDLKKIIKSTHYSEITDFKKALEVILQDELRSLHFSVNDKVENLIKSIGEQNAD